MRSGACSNMPENVMRLALTLGRGTLRLIYRLQQEEGDPNLKVLISQNCTPKGALRVSYRPRFQVAA